MPPAAPPRPHGRRPHVFLDNAASAPPDPAVLDHMSKVDRRHAANPSSVHRPGLRAMREVELARHRIAARLGVEPDTIVFTSGGTEANNLALKGAVWAAPRHRRHLLVSSIEHPCVLETAAWLHHTGQAEVSHIPVDPLGQVDPTTVARMIRPDTLLVSVMHANNEVGTLQPLHAIGEVCRAAGVLLHTDACQSFCKVPLDASALPIDLITINGHKVHGPKGVGALYVRPGVALSPLFHGGGHEEGMRSGTLNVPGIAGFGTAVHVYPPADGPRMAALTRTLLGWLNEALPGVRVNGAGPDGVGNILNISVPGHSGKALFMALDRRGVAVSSSSACHATKLTPSHVLLAMGYSDEQADEALRISLGRFTTRADIEALRDTLVDIVHTASAAPVPEEHQ